MLKSGEKEENNAAEMVRLSHFAPFWIISENISLNYKKKIK